MKTSEDAFVRGGGGTPPCAGLTSCALPKVQSSFVAENSDTGVSTRNAPNGIDVHNPSTLTPQPSQEEHWYALRCTYGREKKAYEHFLNQGIKAFYPTITSKRTSDGKTELLEESRLPNILFAFGTFDDLKQYVYDNVHDETKYLRFYYNQHHDGTKEPMIVPDHQMKSLMIICESDVDDNQLEPFIVEKFKTGQHVKVTQGPFTGVEGIVKRYKGQQRVGIVIEGLFTMTTAYVPSAFLVTII